MRTIRHNSREAKLSDMNFFVRIFPCAWLCICLLLSGCNPKSEEQTQDDAKQSEVQEEATSTPTKSESEKTVEDVSKPSSESSDQDNSIAEATNRSNAESAVQPATQNTTTSTPNKNNRPEGNSTSAKSSAGYSMATGLRNRASAYSKKGDSKSAYQTTLTAWEAVRHAKNDKKSQQLSSQLLQDMEKYGEGLKTPVIQNVLQKPVRYE